MTNSNAAPNDTSTSTALSAIAIVKQQQPIKDLLSKYQNDQYEISFGEVALGGRCGFVGCEWNTLVSMVITAKRANVPSVTFLAEVSGQTPDRGVAPKVRFVDLTDMADSKWNVKL